MLCSFVLLLAGCWGQKASVSGTVMFKDEPLPSGTVRFHGADGRVSYALISKDGKYTITDPPIGNVRITVKSHGAAPERMPSSADNRPRDRNEPAPRAQDRRDSRYVSIPEHYQEEEKSGLTFIVGAGAQTHNIDLKP